MRRYLFAPLLGGLIFSTTCFADASGVLIRASELKAQPFIDAENLASLPDKTPVTVAESKGAWSRVKVNGKEGWVRLLNIKFGKVEEQPVSVGKTITNLGGVIRTGATTSVATTGVKGLSKEDIKTAKPNPLEVRKMEAFKAKPKEVDQFAASRKLVPQDVPELPK